jgi:hypothetical protein
MMIAIDDGIWSGNLNLADVFLLIAAIIFFIAALLPHFRRRVVDGTVVRTDYAVSLVPLGLCLVAIAFMVL